MTNLCNCPELNYMYVTDDTDYGCGIEITFCATNDNVYINADAYYDFNCGAGSIRLPIKCCPFCGKSFS